MTINKRQNKCNPVTGERHQPIPPFLRRGGGHYSDTNKEWYICMKKKEGKRKKVQKEARNLMCVFKGQIKF